MIETGSCMYCGQTYQIESERELTEEELQKEATKVCDCNEAVQASKETETRDTIDELFKDQYPDTACLLKAAVNPVKAQEIRSMTIDTGNCIKGKIHMDKDGNVKVSRILNVKNERTV